jgi:hypothetical protein
VPAFRTSRCDKAERSFDLHFLDADFLFWTAIYGFVLWDRNQSVSDEFDGLDATEKAGIGATLNRCRVLASKIGNELRNKKPEHFVDKLSLADIHASLERAADVLSMVEGSRARGHQRRQ